MGEPKSGLEEKRAAVEKKNTIVAGVVLLLWLGLSFLGQALFFNQNERLDTGAIWLSGGLHPAHLGATPVFLQNTHWG